MSDTIYNQRIEALRSLLASPVWRETVAPSLIARMEEVKKHCCLAESDRTGEFKKSAERLGGMVEGLGWALNVWLAVIQQHDSASALARSQAVLDATPEGGGSPYAPEPVSA